MFLSEMEGGTTKEKQTTKLTIPAFKSTHSTRTIEFLHTQKTS